MKLTITDKFLWNLYEFFELTREVLEPPEVFKIKPFSRIGPDLEKGYWDALHKKRRKQQFGQFIYYLKKKGYIEMANLKGKQGILLTEKGKTKVLQVKCAPQGKKRRKDGKWVMVMYDVPALKKGRRELLRSILKSFHFECLQKSVWVCPYDCLEQISSSLKIHDLDPYVKIFLIKEIT